MFKTGDPVMTKASVRPTRYADRTGVVIALNEGEVGVRFGSADSHSAAVWFRPSELLKVGQGRPGSI